MTGSARKEIRKYSSFSVACCVSLREAGRRELFSFTVLEDTRMQLSAVADL